MSVIKKTFLYGVAILVLLGGFFIGSVHAATSDCPDSPISSDYCYEQNCTGQSSEDSSACNAYAVTVVNRDDGGDTTCLSITNSNESTCCSGNDSTDSPMCVAYDNYDGSGASGGGGANQSANGQTTSSAAKPPANTSTNPAASAPLNIHLTNPLSGVSTIPDAINKILSVVIRVALPLIVVFFIWAGFTFITARGNPEKIKVAKNIFLYTIIGTLLILGAWVITNAIIGTVNAIIS